MTARRVWSFVAVLVVSITLLAGCATAHAQGLVRQACGHVTTSLAIYKRSLTEPPPAAAADRYRAIAQLRQAMPIAATAAGEAPQWQALMATLAESSRGVPESYLVSALSQQCSSADSAGGPSGPPTTLPPTSVPAHPPSTRSAPVGS